MTILAEGDGEAQGGRGEALAEPRPATADQGRPGADAPSPHLGKYKEIGVRSAPVIEGYRPDPLDRERVKSRCMRFLRTYSVRIGARGCMVDPVATVVTITVDGTTGRGHVSGVKRCASPWACPTCSFAIRNRRAREITELVESAEARGHSALLLTLTIPHAAGERLASLLAVVNGAQRRMWAGRWGQRFRARWGMVGQVRAIEMTYGVRRGWGPHVHAVLILERAALDNAEWVEMWGQLYQRWQSVVVAAGGRLPNAYGVDLALVNDPRQVAEYITDAGGWTIGAEVAQGPVKMGRSSGRWAPFALLAGAAMWGDKDAVDLWTEYEQATAGKHAIVASAGLYEAYGVGVVDDEEAAVEDVREALAVVEVDPVMWMILAAVDQQRPYVAAVEEWAAAGCRGQPPDPAGWVV